MRLVILCEGHTEQRVLKDFLAPYCTNFDHVEVISSQGADRLKSEFKYLAEIALLDNPDAFVFCLIDVYQAPFSYPSYVGQTAEPVSAKFAYIKKNMEREIDKTLSDRFFAFPVVMEVETWLLADPAPLNDYLKPDTLLHYHTPETVSHPAHELKELFRKHKKSEYSKTVNGERLFNQTDAQKVYEDNCPHFELLINALRRVQGETIADNPDTYSIPHEKLYQRLADLEKKRNQIIEEAIDLSKGDPRLKELDTEDKEISEEIKRIEAEIREKHQTDE